MIERHYNRFLVERQAHLVNGINPWVNFMAETGQTDPAILAQVSEILKERAE
jgi:hypothetical protein